MFLLSRYCASYATKFQEGPQRLNHETRLYNFDQNPAKASLVPKRNF